MMVRKSSRHPGTPSGEHNQRSRYSGRMAHYDQYEDDIVDYVGEHSVSGRNGKMASLVRDRRMSESGVSTDEKERAVMEFLSPGSHWDRCLRGDTSVSDV